LYLLNFGSADQHSRWLRPAIEGRIVGSLAVTEPDAGSDVAALRTSARIDGERWLINGSKTYITNGAWADFVVVAAKTDVGTGHGGITLFVIEAGAPGFSARPVRTLGWRPSQKGELSFNDVLVPDSHRLGDVGAGFYSIMQNFEWERLVMALAAVAGAEQTYQMARAYALERKAFGRPVGNFQVWRHRFADLATRIEAGRALTYHALRLVVAGHPAIGAVAMAKLFTSELAVKVADECVQVHGGYGYMSEFSAERALRDARLGPIGGGTSEIMKEVIGKSLGL
jgi:acyl-CoA dehydrogenase